jgi:hypothetical protein
MYLHDHLYVLLSSPFVTITTVRVLPGGYSRFKEHGGAKSEVWCTIYRFKLPSSAYAADHSKAASLCAPQMYVFVVSYYYGDTCASIVDFLSTVSIIPLPLALFISILLPPPPRPSTTLPQHSLYICRPID